jgi:uncharacterized protein (DUF433 family)
MRERIQVDTNVHFRKPCVASTRVPVQSVLELVEQGLVFDEIISDYYEDLEADDIRAYIHFAISLM